MKRKTELFIQNEIQKETKKNTKENILQWDLLLADCWDEILLKMDFFCLAKSMKISSWLRKKIILISLLKRWITINMKTPDIFLKEKKDPFEIIKQLAHYHLMLLNGSYDKIPLDIPIDSNGEGKKINMSSLISNGIAQFTWIDTPSICFHKTQPFCLIQVFKPSDLKDSNLKVVTFSLFHREKRIAIFEEKNVQRMTSQKRVSTISGYLFAIFKLKDVFRIIAVPVDNPLFYLHLDIKFECQILEFCLIGDFLCLHDFGGHDAKSLWIFTLNDFVEKNQEKIVTNPFLSNILGYKIFSIQQKYLLIDIWKSKDMLLMTRDKKENTFVINKFEKNPKSKCRYFHLEENILVLTFLHGTYELPESLLNSTKEFNLDNDCKFTPLDMEELKFCLVFRNDQKELVCINLYNECVSFATKTKLESLNPYQPLKLCDSNIVLSLQRDYDLQRNHKMSLSMMSFVDIENMYSNTFSNIFPPKKEKSRPYERDLMIFWSHTTFYAVGKDGQLYFINFLCKNNSILMLENENQ